MRKLRSSKFFAQKAISSLFCFLDGSAKVINHQGQIKTIKSHVIRNRLDRVSAFRIDVFDNPVMIVSIDPLAADHPRKITKIEIFSGFHYDGEGNPGKKTKEVLNALLNALSYRYLLPEGVRVYVSKNDDKDKNLCRLHHKEQSVILNEDYCNVITLFPDSDKLIIQETDPSLSYQADEVKLYALQEH